MNVGRRVIDNRAESRFEREGEGEGEGDGALAELIYRRRANRLVLVHTEVPEAMTGQGVGGELVKAAVDRAAAEGLTVVPLCPFARRWLESHHETAETVNVDWGEPPDT